MRINNSNSPWEVFKFAQEQFAEHEKNGYVYVYTRNTYSGIVEHEIVHGLEKCFHVILREWKNGREVWVMPRA